MENIKLVIWDLDETFWQGTLSDNTSSGVHAVVVDNIHLVRKLTDRGIICFQTALFSYPATPNKQKETRLG